MQFGSAAAKSEEMAWYRLHSATEEEVGVDAEAAAAKGAGPTAAPRSRLAKSLMEVAEPTVANDELADPTMAEELPDTESDAQSEQPDGEHGGNADRGVQSELPDGQARSAAWKRRERKRKTCAALSVPMGTRKKRRERRTRAKLRTTLREHGVSHADLSARADSI